MTNILVKLADDSFLHFTLQSRAEEIISSNKLLVNPPYDKFGIDGVQAVSVNHGVYQPNVQLSHIRGHEIVGILFKTNTMPRIGYPEEIIWDKDVALLDPKVLSLKDSIELLHIDNGADYTIVYESLFSVLLNGGGAWVRD